MSEQVSAKRGSRMSQEPDEQAARMFYGRGGRIEQPPKRLYACSSCGAATSAPEGRWVWHSFSECFNGEPVFVEYTPTAQAEREKAALVEVLQRIADGQWNIDRRPGAGLGVRGFARAALAKEDGAG